MHRITQHLSGRARAVTFNELLIVIVITAVLSMFFVLSSRYLIVRSKIARVQEEQRVLQRALGNYQMDYSDFPRNEIGLKALNAPTTYLTSIPKDPFGGSSNSDTYFYYRQPERDYYYVVISAGPDADIDFEDFIQQHATPMTNLDPGEGSGGTEPDDSNRVRMQYRDLRDFLEQRTYDPTNGLKSDGDIFSYMRK